MTNIKNVLVIILAFIVLTLGQNQQLTILNTEMLEDASKATIYDSGKLNSIYNDTIYNTATNCRSGDLQIINNTNGQSLILSYANFAPLDLANNVYIDVSPNDQPLPVPNIDPVASTITIDFNCPTSINNNNYFNKISLHLPGVQHVSFLLNCDPGNRHKPFQFGYLILSVINAIIIVGVAMHSHIWSIKYKGLPLAIELKWIPFVVFNIASVTLLIGLTLLAYKDFSTAFETLRYFGVGVSMFFVFICFNESFYLIKKLRKNVYKVIRWCDLASIGCTIILTIISAFFQSWILYNVLATCICVGCIKLFYFDNLKQAFISMGIYVVNVTSIAIALHYILPADRSYNDYATQLSSPLFFEVPDLINGLFKKCSWLVVVDVIVPGVTLSYLRMYDQNRSSRYGGVYTWWGNITFVLSTALWIGLEAVYPFSIPFSLVTYLSLMLVVLLIALKRNDWKTLSEGTFEKSRSTLNQQFLEQRGDRFSVLVDGALDPLKKSTQKQSNPQRSRDSLNN